MVGGRLPELETPACREPVAFELMEQALPEVEGAALQPLPTNELVREYALLGVGKPSTPDPRTLPPAAPEVPQPDRAMLSAVPMGVDSRYGPEFVDPAVPLRDSRTVPRTRVTVDAPCGRCDSVFAGDPPCRFEQKCWVSTC